MIPGPTNLYKCPFCGKGKPLMSIISGNETGAVVWSDSLHDSPMLPTLSRVQRCPDCGKYFFIDDITPTVLEDEDWRNFHVSSSETGVLDYVQSLEALSQFEGQSLTEEQWEWLHMNLLFAYNDWRTRETFILRKHLRELANVQGVWAQEWREHAEKQLAECAARDVRREEERFSSNARWIISHFPKNRLLCAELYREMGEFAKCIAILDEIGNNNLTLQFRIKAEAGDTEVFRMHLGKPTC